MLLIIAAVVIFLILLASLWYVMSTPATPAVSKNVELPPTVKVEEGPPVVNGVVEEPEVVPSPPETVAIQTPSGVTYTFHQGMDSGGNDIDANLTVVGIQGLVGNISTLKAWCTEREACKGFNTNGWMKNVILPQTSWAKWDFTGNPNMGLFVKN
jgi:Na+-transporting methylmalonyl-CoA/oxaloacetate decarboxylase gamma subunit